MNLGNLDTAIASLKRKLESWEGQIGIPGSAMTKKDARFLRSRVKWLVDLRSKTENTIISIENEVKDYTKGWWR